MRVLVDLARKPGVVVDRFLSAGRFGAVVIATDRRRRRFDHVVGVVVSVASVVGVAGALAIVGVFQLVYVVLMGRLMGWNDVDFGDY